MDPALLRKLGVKPNRPLLIVDAPDGLMSGSPSPDDLIIRQLNPESIDKRLGQEIVLAFAGDQAHLEFVFFTIFRWMGSESTLWLSWPKKASGRTTDLNFSVVQRVGLDHGLVDNKVCSVDATWSALRFVVRKDHRPDWNPSHFL